MTKQGVLASVVVCLLPQYFYLGVHTASAKQCSSTMPSKPKGHWSYRIIDGRKCWYEGQNNLPKSLLKWAEKTSPPEKTASLEKTLPTVRALPRLEKEALPRLEKEALPPAKEAMSTITERWPSNADQSACCSAITFESRWRELLSRD